MSYLIYISFVRHKYNPNLKTYGGPVAVQFSIRHLENDPRTIDAVCRCVLQKKIKKFSLRPDDFLHYIFPMLPESVDETSCMGDFVNLYKAANPNDKSLLIVVNMFGQRDVHLMN